MIRPAVIHEADSVIDLLLRFHRESSFKEIAVDMDLLCRVVQRAIESDAMLCLVHADESGLGGLFIGYATNFFFSRERAVWDLAFYVRPERRGSPIAAYLLRSVAAWARSVRARALYVGVGAGIDPDRTGRFLVRSGFVEVGGNYRLDLAGALTDDPAAQSTPRLDGTAP